MARGNFLPILLTLGLAGAGVGAYYLATKKEGDATPLKIPSLDEIIAYLTGLFGGGGGGGDGNGDGDGGGDGGNGDGGGDGDGNGTPPPPGTLAVTTDKSVYKKGATINVTGQGFKGGEKVGLDLSKDGGGRIQTASDKTANSSGKFTGTLTASVLGNCWINAHGRTSKKFAHKKISVTATGSGGDPNPPPVPGGTSGSTTLGAAGDYGSGRNSNWKKVTSVMKSQRIKIALGLGDYSYTSASAWAPVVNDLKNAGIPFRGAMGNHDGSGYAGVSGTATFNSGPACIIILNTESGASGNAAYAQKILAATKQPWKILMFHKPTYTNSSDHGAEKGLASALKPIINKYGVQLVLMAHNHNYQRIYKSDQPKCMFVVAGTGGESHYNLKASESGTKYMNDNDFGFTKLTINGSTLKGQFITTSGAVKDSWTQTLGANANLAYVYNTNAYAYPVYLPPVSEEPFGMRISA